MNTKTLRRLLLAVLATASTLAATGCAVVFRDSRDAAWDPKPSSGHALHDQIPNWDDATVRRCGGHLRDLKPGMTRRC